MTRPVSPRYLGESLLRIPSGILALWIFLWLTSILAIAGLVTVSLLVSGSVSLSRSSGASSRSNVTDHQGTQAQTRDPYLLIPVEPQ